MSAQLKKKDVNVKKIKNERHVGADLCVRPCRGSIHAAREQLNNVIAVVGGSNSGKTTLIEKMIPVFKKRGYNVCVIKHIHGVLELDKKGKDTYKFAQSGADTVMMQNKNTLAMVKKLKKELKAEEIIQKYAKEHDLVIVEGFKKADIPQIWVCSENTGVKMRTECIIAVVGKLRKNLNVPVFDKNDFTAIADFIEKKIIKLTHKK